MLRFVGNNAYIGIELIGFILSLTYFIANIVLIRFTEYKFVNYAKERNHELWQKYKDFEPRMWWRFVYFIRSLRNTGDNIIEKLRINTLRYEKYAMMAIILVVVIFALMIVTVILMQQQTNI